MTPFAQRPPLSASPLYALLLTSPGHGKITERGMLQELNAIK